MFNENMFLSKNAKILLGILVVVIILFFGAKTIKTLGSSYSESGEYENTIVVAGKGEVVAVPDIAEVTFSAVERGQNVTEAQKKATDKMNAALDSLKEFGIEDKDVQTSGYNAYPQYQYYSMPCTQFSCPPSTQTIVGYEVRQSVTVKIRKIEDAGKVLQALGSSGVSDISGLNFTIDAHDEKVREARKMAIEDAKEQAKILARDLGVKIVGIVSFNESGNYPVPIYYAKDMAMGMGGANEASAPQIPVGENKIISNVTVTYEIK